MEGGRGRRLVVGQRKGGEGLEKDDGSIDVRDWDRDVVSIDCLGTV